MGNTTIIAEAGVNHNGSLDTAIALAKMAKIAGADFVKFQTFITDLNISKNALKAEYQKANSEKHETQYEMVRKLELSFENFTFLKTECDRLGIGFLSTGFDFPSVDFLTELGMPFFKIPSGEITNYPYLKHVAQKGKPVILSTGMATLEEIGEALDVLQRFGLVKNDITILHCNTEYPTPMEDVNLKAMLHIGQHFGVNIGYSDHTMGIEVPIAAVALGATVVEKHFTLDRTLPGPDHKASLEPIELKAMVTAIRNIELAIGGSGVKEPSESEKKNKPIARKSIHTTKNLLSGHILDESDLVVLRPGDGISAMQWEMIVGKTVAKDIPAQTKLEWEMLK